MIKGVDVVYLHSSHHELGAWYSEVLGFEKGYGDAHWQEFQMEEGSRFAVDYTAFPKSVVEKQAVMISFKVDDIEAAVTELAAKGVAFYPSREKAILDVGPSLVATFADPEGNWMQLSQPKSHS